MLDRHYSRYFLFWMGYLASLELARSSSVCWSCDLILAGARTAFANENSILRDWWEAW